MDGILFHPKVVHLPIALGILMPLLAAGLTVAWWRNWLPARSWALAVVLQAILLGSGFLALQTGEAEEDRVEHLVPEQALEAHEEAAEAFVWSSAAVFGVMLLALLARRRKSGLGIATAATVGTLVVLGLGYRTGQAGGDLVYRHNAGQAYSGAKGIAPTGGAASAGHDDEYDDDD